MLRDNHPRYVSISFNRVTIYILRRASSYELPSPFPFNFPTPLGYLSSPTTMDSLTAQLSLGLKSVADDGALSLIGILAPILESIRGYEAP
jgi:hypothetical protein